MTVEPGEKVIVDSDRKLVTALVRECGMPGGWVLAEVPGMRVAKNIFYGRETAEEVEGRILTDGNRFRGDGNGGVYYSDEAGYGALIDQLAWNFADEAAMVRVGGKVVEGWRRAGRVGDTGPYMAGVASLAEYVSDDLGRAQLELVAESLEKSISPVDGKTIMSQKGLELVRGGVRFKSYGMAGYGGRGFKIFVWGGDLPDGIVDEVERRKAYRSLERVSKLLRVDDEEIDGKLPVRCAVLPGVFLRNYAYADADKVVVLPAQPSKGTLGVGKNVLDQRTCDHEHVHFVLYRLFKKYPPVPDLIEGVADGVAYYLAGERYEKEKGWGIVLNRAVEKMKVSPAATKLSGTRLLEEEGGNLYLKAYEMRVLVGTLAAMFPKSWVEVVKEMYRLSCEENLTDRGGRLLIANGQKVLGVQNRELLFGLLAGGLMKARGEEKQRWLGDLNRAGVGIRNDILAELVEVVAEEKRRSGKRK